MKMTITEQKKLKKTLLKNGAGIYTLEVFNPEQRGDYGLVFNIKDTLVSFLVPNWDEYFTSRELQNSIHTYDIRIEMFGIAPDAIGNHGSPFLGGAIITDVFYKN